MAKPKRKKNLPKITKKRIFLIIFFIFLCAVATFVAVKAFEASALYHKQKDLMRRSLQVTQAIYEQFSDKVTYPQQKTLPTRGRCSDGGKYSTRYTCGPEANLTVSDLDDSSFLDLNNAAIKVYKESGYFERIGSSQPHDNKLSPGITATIGSRLKGSDMRCYYISNYVSGKKTATFSWGCTLVSNNKFF